MRGRSTTDAVFSLRQIIERYREEQNSLQMVFIDLTKACNRVPKDLIWWALGRKKMPKYYVNIIKDMYDRAVTSVRSVGGVSGEFPVLVGLHQGFISGPASVISSGSGTLVISGVN